MGITYTEYKNLLKEYMGKNGMSDEELKQYNPMLQDKIKTGMYKIINSYYADDAIGSKQAMNDNKVFLGRYINNLRE